MHATDTLKTLRRIVISVAISIIGTGVTGCAAAHQHLTAFYSGALIRAEHKHDLANVRDETREALAKQQQEALRMEAQHTVEQARIEAENLSLERQFCQANQEALQRVVKSNIRDQVETKMNFNVVQGLEAGELEVDVPELEALIKRRTEEDKQEQENLERQPKQPCACCDQPCGCEPGRIRRHCLRCRHKPCEAEKDCGGPEALRKIAQEPLKRPLRPAEIPLKLPVRLTFGMNGPEMEAAKIRRIPVLTPEEQENLIRGGCNRCGHPGPNPGCDCHLHSGPSKTGTYRAPPVPSREPASTSSPVNVDFLEPPKPTPDDSTRRAAPPPNERFQNVSTQFNMTEQATTPPQVQVGTPVRSSFLPRP